MTGEQKKIIQALRQSIQMEQDGKAYYEKAGKKSSLKAGKDLFGWLAEQEDWHRQRFEQIYQAIQEEKSWPLIDMKAGRGEKLATVFSTMKKTPEPEAARSELKAITTAMEMEQKTRDFYQQQAAETQYEAQGKFYTALAAEERKHYLALVDYREYLVDPAGWFRKSEHHSLDGG